MNKLKGYVQSIENDEAISIIKIEVEGSLISAIRTEEPESSAILEVGDSVMVSFKETAMSIGKNLTGELSIQNRFDVTIKAVTMHKVLTKITFDFRHHQLVSVITTASAKRMQLKPGDSAQGLVKTTDMLFTKTDT
ncbi:MAG TPA: TOBE domain-containing protein [Arachidicoccus sp.]|nr:TOBE domain-containing protein [Arachidicoccus sp.]